MWPLFYSVREARRRAEAAEAQVESIRADIISFVRDDLECGMLAERIEREPSLLPTQSDSTRKAKQLARQIIDARHEGVDVMIDVAETFIEREFEGVEPVSTEVEAESDHTVWIERALRAAQSEHG